MFLRAHGRKSMPVCLEALLFLCSYVLMFSALAANLITHKQRNTTISHRHHQYNLVWHKSVAKVSLRHCTHHKKCATCTQMFAPLPVRPPINECACFFCHLTLFARNKLIYRGFKSVRWFQTILHTPAHILHTPPRCPAVDLDVCGGFYATGT